MRLMNLFYGFLSLQLKVVQKMRNTANFIDLILAYIKIVELHQL